MMSREELTYPGAAVRNEHDNTPPETKRVSLYGWDIENTQKTKIRATVEGSIVAALGGAVDTNNSTSTPLGIGEAFTGTATDILNYGTVFVTVYSDVASATDGLDIQQSPDGTNWDNGDSYTVPAGVGKNYAVNPHCRYLRVVYTNGAASQSEFRLQTILKGNSTESSHRIQDSIVDDDDARLVKSVITGKDDFDTFRNVSISRSQRLKTVSQPYGYAVAEGDIPDHEPLLKFGTRSAVAAATASTVWEGNTARYQYMSTAQQLKISSASVNDTSVGTGARTLRLVGLDSNYAELEETVTMNGTSIVTSTGSFIRIFRAYVVTCGTLYTNAGKITITNNAGTVEQAVINAGDAQTLMSIWTVPTGKTLYITKGSASTDSNKGSRISLFARKLDGGILYPWTIKYRGYIFSGAEQVPFEIPFVVPERTDIEMRVTTPTSAGTTAVGGTFAGWYEVDA
jgi:hypothetical protein